MFRWFCVCLVASGFRGRCEGGCLSPTLLHTSEIFEAGIALYGSVEYCIYKTARGLQGSSTNKPANEDGYGLGRVFTAPPTPASKSLVRDANLHTSTVESSRLCQSAQFFNAILSFPPIGARASAQGMQSANAVRLSSRKHRKITPTTESPAK